MPDFPPQIEIESDGRRIVYVLRPDGHTYSLGTIPAHPTGKVWVRFREGIDASTKGADLERAGYRFESSPRYAPNAAWVVAADPATALSQLDALRAVDGVEHVEPQLLVEGSHRDRV